MDIDLWDLQAVLAVTMGTDVEYRERWLARLRDNAVHQKISENTDVASSILGSLKASSASNPAVIGFVAIFSHGGKYGIFSQNGGSKGRTQ